MNCYGVRGTANNWFSSYFENRTQFVSVNGYFPDLHLLWCTAGFYFVTFFICYLIVVKGGHIPPYLGQPPFSKIPPFLDIQDVPTFYRAIRKTKVLNESLNWFVYKFYWQRIFTKNVKCKVDNTFRCFLVNLWKIGISLRKEYN